MKKIKKKMTTGEMSEWWRCVQSNDISPLIKMIEEGFDVNLKDNTG